ncbi:hypothetical protein ACFLXF_02720 [Chloroflexota bacterium]
MSKKMKVIMAMLMAVLLLAALPAAVVLAQDEPEAEAVPELWTGGAGMEGLVARMAEILDIPQEKLVAAFEQARQEAREDGICLNDEGDCEGCGERYAERRMNALHKQEAQGNRSLQRARVSQGARNRQMISAHRGWQESVPNQPAD